MSETTTSRARVQSVLAYQGYDRLPTFYQCTPEFDAELCARLGVSTSQRDAVLGVDMKDLDPDYVGPELRTHPDGTWDGIFGERYANIPYENGTYPEAVYLPYAGISDPADLDRLPFPSPDWYDYSTLPAKCAAAGEYALAYGDAGIPDFMNGIARRRGVGQVLLDIGNQDPVYLKLMAKTHEFWIEWCERGLRSAGGRIDILALGEDYGSQRGLLISPRTFDRMFRPYMQQYIDLAHKYGARAMMHSCGSVRALFPVSSTWGWTSSTWCRSTRWVWTFVSCTASTTGDRVQRHAERAVDVAVRNHGGRPPGGRAACRIVPRWRPDLRTDASDPAPDAGRERVGDVSNHRQPASGAPAGSPGEHGRA